MLAQYVLQLKTVKAAMAISATLAVAGTTALIKRAIDDIYAIGKERAINTLGKSRADLKEANIARALIGITKVKTLWNVEKEVSLSEFYYPSTLQFQAVKKRVNSLKDFARTGNFVIQGTAGQGKSIFLRYLCGQELTETSSSNRIPIFVELRRIQKDLNVESLILEALSKFKLPFTKEAWKLFAESGKFILLLDAFDEIDPSFAGSALSDIEHLIDLYGTSIQVLVTARPEADIQRSSKFRVCKLSPLQSADHLPFLRKICADKTQADSLMKVINASKSDIQGLLTTPLMMTLLVILYKTLQTVPDNVPKFYEELFDVLFYRHDHSKPGFRRKRFTQLDDSSIKRLFSAFCFFVRLESIGVLSTTQLEACVTRAEKACSLSVEPELFKNELIKTVCLLQQDGFEISFIHKSVAQYYAAAFVASSGESFAESFYKLAAKDTVKWQLEIRFLAMIDAYRFNKFYELPLLEKIAKAIEHDFGTPSKNSEALLQQHLAKSISFHCIVGDDAKSLNAWSRPVNSDYVLAELGSAWATEIFRCARENRDFESCLIKQFPKKRVSLDKEKGENSTLRNEIICGTDKMAGEIKKYLPALEKNIIEDLNIRKAKAQNIIDTEHAKMELFEGLLD